MPLATERRHVHLCVQSADNRSRVALAMRLLDVALRAVASRTSLSVSLSSSGQLLQTTCKSDWLSAAFKDKIFDNQVSVRVQ